MRRRKGELLVIGREPDAEESDLQLNLENWKMENTRPVLNRRDLIIGGGGGGAMREERKARKQAKCWKMEKLWRQGEKGEDVTGHPKTIRVQKITAPQEFSRPPSWAIPLLVILLHLR